MKWLSLVLLALLSGVAWRAELEWRGGWAGLTWITYFHWAIPVCGLAFVGWVVSVTRVRQPFGLAASLIVLFSVAYLACEYLRLQLPLRVAHQGQMKWMAWLIPVLWTLLPLGFGIVCRSFGANVRLSGIFASCALFVLSWPFAIFVRTFFEERGSPDAIHALKSGFVIPLLIVSLGLPILWRDRKSVGSEREVG